MEHYFLIKHLHMTAAALSITLPWLGAKLLALLAYIGIGTIAIKRGATPTVRALAALVALAIFAYMMGAAICHSPLSWLAWVRAINPKL